MRTLLLALSLLAGPAFAADDPKEIERYIRLFDDNLATPDRAVDDLGWKGFSDPRLFDVVEERLLEEAGGARRRNKHDRNRVGRLIKALGFSGQQKYARTLESFVDDRAYARYARQALGNLALYEKWNPIIASRENFDPRLGADANRVMNMLRAPDIGLVRVGAKRVFFAKMGEPELLDAVAVRLRDLAPAASDPEEVDTAGWLCNALSHSEREQDRALLRQVSGTAASHKLRGRAEKALAGPR